MLIDGIVQFSRKQLSYRKDGIMVTIIWKLVAVLIDIKLTTAEYMTEGFIITQDQ